VRGFFVRPGAWVIWLLLVTLLARSAFAASSDFCTMPANQPAPVGLFQGEHAHLNYAQLEHDAMQHDAGEVQDRHGCCAGDKGDADCMMSGCLSMMPPVAHFASPIHAGSIAIVFHVPAFPRPPNFPLLRPPIA
tara:strand:+ start:2875 stop:3276 length:402 start_codon:yes stop_codon:yes gene_type:complete